MSYAKVESEMAPRTRRFMRELDGTDMQQDPEVRYWKRVSAIVCVGCMASVITLLVFAGAYASAAMPAAPVESVAGPADGGAR